MDSRVNVFPFFPIFSSYFSRLLPLFVLTDRNLRIKGPGLENSYYRSTPTCTFDYYIWCPEEILDVDKMSNVTCVQLVAYFLMCYKILAKLHNAIVVYFEGLLTQYIF